MGGQRIDIESGQGVVFLDSAPEPLIEISPESGTASTVPLTIRASDWLGSPPQWNLTPPSSGKLSAGEILDAMLDSDPDEVLLAVSAWLGVHAGRIRG